MKTPRMKFLNYRGERFVLTADIVNWLIQFADDLENGIYPNHGQKESQLVWNIVAGLVAQDLQPKEKRNNGNNGD